MLIYNAGSNYPNPGGSFGSLSLGGNGSVTLTPLSVAAAGNQPLLAGVILFQARDNTKPLSISGKASGMEGTIYAPAAEVQVSGNGLTRASILANKLTLSGNANSALTASTAAGAALEGTGLSADQLLGGAHTVAIVDPTGFMTADYRTRISAAIQTLDENLAPSGVRLIEQDDPSSGIADVRISIGDTSACGTAANGVLGCTLAGDVILIAGWDFFLGADPVDIRADQYDFQTIVSHELGHAAGLEHSTDANSLMYARLAPGTARRGLSGHDRALLVLDDAPEAAESEPLWAAPLPSTVCDG